jgi:hypothetical protein
MPAKHRRSRRITPQSRKIDTSIDISPISIQLKPSGLPIKSTTPLGDKSSPTADLNSLKYVFSEIKWIGVVTGIILVLLVVGYFIFR